MGEGWTVTRIVKNNEWVVEKESWLCYNKYQLKRVLIERSLGRCI